MAGLPPAARTQRPVWPPSSGAPAAPSLSFGLLPGLSRSPTGAHRSPRPRRRWRAVIIPAPRRARGRSPQESGRSEELAEAGFAGTSPPSTSGFKPVSPTSALGSSLEGSLGAYQPTPRALSRCPGDSAGPLSMSPVALPDCGGRCPPGHAGRPPEAQLEDSTRGQSGRSRSVLPMRQSTGPLLSWRLGRLRPDSNRPTRFLAAPPPEIEAPADASREKLPALSCFPVVPLVGRSPGLLTVSPGRRGGRGPRRTMFALYALFST